MINPLIIVRDLHFASSVVMAGIVFFDLLIASPVLRGASLPKAEPSFRRTAGLVFWTSFVLSIVSAVAWLCLLSERIADRSLTEVIADGTVWTVLTQTRFGMAWEIRLVLATLLALCLLLRQAVAKGPSDAGLMTVASLLAGGYLGALAFAGHGEEGVGVAQNIHLAADVLHLNAAGLWLGALVPLALLLAALRSASEPGWALAAARAGGRFSTLGILAVGVLLVSGLVNAAFLLGGMHSLTDTAYGRLLLLKVVLFAAMVGLAGINRQYLLPRLIDEAAAGQETNKGAHPAKRLVRSAVVEIAFGLAIVCVVGALGIMAPATEMAAHLH